MPLSSNDPPDRIEGWPDLSEDEEVALETARATWTPDYKRRYRWPSGETSGPGCDFKPDGTGGGPLWYRSSHTLRWMQITKRAHGATA